MILWASEDVQSPCSVIEITDYANILAIPLDDEEGFTGPLGGLHATLFQNAGIQAVLQLLGVCLPQVKRRVVGAATV